jgi:hypothetical protein
LPCLYPALCISLLAAGSPITPELIADCAYSARAAGRFSLQTHDPQIGNSVVRLDPVAHHPRAKGQHHIPMGMW